MQPVNLVAAIAATTKSGVVPPHSESGYRRNGCQLAAYLMRSVLRTPRGNYASANKAPHPSPLPRGARGKEVSLVLSGRVFNAPGTKNILHSETGVFPIGGTVDIPYQFEVLLHLVFFAMHNQGQIPCSQGHIPGRTHRAGPSAVWQSTNVRKNPSVAVKSSTEGYTAFLTSEFDFRDKGKGNSPKLSGSVLRTPLENSRSKELPRF
jgi:hypothetical protein